MTTPNQIAWGSYQSYEGPFYRGSARYTFPAKLSDNDKYLAVIVATESGGIVDAINMYDRMILTAGLIQWGEAGQHSVSDMLGTIANRSANLLEPLQPALDRAGAKFAKNAKGRWRFFFNDARGEVDTLAEQKELFLLHSNGLKGTWDAESKEYAKLWASCVANVLAQPEAMRGQVDFTAPRLLGFAMPEAKTTLWGPNEPTTNDGWVGALRAGFISYAANLPAVANSMLKIAISQPGIGPKWSPEWCTAILKQLTFGPNIAIYPIRYNAIRPVLEKLYGVDLPDFSVDLQKWQVDHHVDTTIGAQAPSFMEVREIQAELIAEGYDLGPAGADGIMGQKTKKAIFTFQGLHRLVADGIVGPMTRKALLTEWTKRQG